MKKSCRTEISVLHDMDEPQWNVYLALGRGVRLIVYVICRILGVRIRFVDDIYEEVRENADTLIKLDKLLGITPVMGIRREVLDTYPGIMEELERHGVDVREHIHIGGNRDPNRKRLWIPSLNQPRGTWHYDTDYNKGKRILLKKGQLPIFHVDRPDFLTDYINFLYDIIVEGESVYEEE